MSDATVHHGDCLDVLATLADASVDAVVTDPPYGLGFMGKEWDSIKAEASRPASADSVDAKFRNVFPRTGKGPAATAFDGAAFGAWCLEWTAEAFRVLKPGGHMLAFGGTRTFHRLACAVEDAGFEIRDSIAWLYGSGFPKSLDVSKAIDKAAGAEREAGLPNPWAGRRSVSLDGRGGTVAVEGGDFGPTPDMLTAPATDDARTWQGWGTALKPAHEPIVVARKPLAGTVAANVLAHGTGALNVDGCRVEHRDAADLAESAGKNRHADFGSGPRENKVYGADNRARGEGGNYDGSRGRWPANVILDESQAEALDAQSGESVSKAGGHRGENNMGNGVTLEGGKGIPFYERGGHDDSGGASRFFYVAKADSGERVRLNGTAHPTVKPLTLMRWLVRLVTPPGGTVLDPFAGSGTTVEAAILEGFDCIAIEREADYLPLIHQRIHRRRDPVAAVRATLEDAGLFDLIAPEDPA